jgi:glycosyltransferase involved in cell wall biosynthesis
MKVPITFIIPTRNEERNIAGAVETVSSWADQVFVLDSFSEDRTCEIAEEMGAETVRHEFVNFSGQKNWALANLPLRNEWIFFLDADERISPKLRAELSGAVEQGTSDIDGYYIPRLNYFLGVPLRHGGWHPDRRLVFFRHPKGRYESRSVHEHVVVEGRVANLRNPIIHYNDNKGFHQYFDRHNAYSTMEALEAHKSIFEPRRDSIFKASLTGSAPQRRRAIKEWAYRNLPYRPLFKFVWSYVFRLGFLDGSAGFKYSALQAFYEFQVGLKIEELKSHPSSTMHSYARSVRPDLLGSEGVRGSTRGEAGISQGAKEAPAVALSALDRISDSNAKSGLGFE